MMEWNSKVTRHIQSPIVIRLLIVSVTILLILGIGNISYANKDTYIISPRELEGPVGGIINTAEVFVQKITLTEVSSVSNIEIVDDVGTKITHFPKEEYKAIVRTADSKIIVGFLNLKPYKLGNSIPISMNQSGEFLFYQSDKPLSDGSNSVGEDRVFSNLGSAKEGPIYFWRPGKSLNSRPLCLLIGRIENGTFISEDYIEASANTIRIKKGV